MIIIIKVLQMDIQEIMEDYFTIDDYNIITIYYIS